MYITKHFAIVLASAMIREEISIASMILRQDAYLIPESVEEFSYTKDGKEIIESQYKFKMEFPQKKDK